MTTVTVPELATLWGITPTGVRKRLGLVGLAPVARHPGRTGRGLASLYDRRAVDRAASVHGWGATRRSTSSTTATPPLPTPSGMTTLDLMTRWRVCRKTVFLRLDAAGIQPTRVLGTGRTCRKLWPVDAVLALEVDPPWRRNQAHRPATARRAQKRQAAAVHGEVWVSELAARVFLRLSLAELARLRNRSLLVHRPGPGGVEYLQDALEAVRRAHRVDEVTRHRELSPPKRARVDHDRDEPPVRLHIDGDPEELSFEMEEV